MAAAGDSGSQQSQHTWISPVGLSRSGGSVCMRESGHSYYEYTLPTIANANLLLIILS